MPTKIFSFGHKHRPISTLPPNALVIDVRDLHYNPYKNPALRPLTGLDPEVQTAMLTSQNFSERLAIIRVQARLHNGPIYIGCVGGRHRSVFIALLLAGEFGVPVEHLDIKVEHK